MPSLSVQITSARFLFAFSRLSSSARVLTSAIVTFAAGHFRAIEIPIKLTGSIRSPKATLDLTEEKKALFEDRVLQLVTDFYNDKLGSAAKRFLGENESGDLMQKIESSVKELLKKLL